MPLCPVLLRKPEKCGAEGEVPTQASGAIALEPTYSLHLPGQAAPIRSAAQLPNISGDKT